MTNVFGPQGSHATTSQPVNSAKLRYGSSQTWFSDCTAPGQGDGTIADAEFFNNIIGNLSRVIDAGNVTPQKRGDMYLLLKSIQAVARAVIAATDIDPKHLPKPTPNTLGGVKSGQADIGSLLYGVGPDGGLLFNTISSLGVAAKGSNSDITSLQAGVTIPTPATGDTSTKIVNAAFVQASIAALVGAAPLTLDTIAEIDAAINNDPNFATTVMAALATKAVSSRQIATGSGLSGGGDLTADRTLSLAVVAAGSLLANISGGAAAPSATSLSSLLDFLFGNPAPTGTLLGRGPAGWTAIANDVAGYILTSNGPSALGSYKPPGTALVPRAFLGGLGLANNGAAPNTALDITAGQATSSDASTFMALGTSYTKSLTATWAVGSGNGGLDTGAVQASTWYHVYLIMRTDTNVADILLSQAPSLSASVTATSASPAVFSWGSALPFQNGAPIVLSGTTAPTGFTFGTTYYVVSANQAAGTFSLAATQGGAAIASSSTGSGLIANSNPVLPANYTKSRRIGSVLTNTSSQIVPFTQVGDDFLLKTPVNNANAVTVGTTPVFFAATVPIGVAVFAKTRAYFVSSVGQGISLRSFDESSAVPGTIVGDYSAFSSNASANMALSGTNAIRTNLSQQVVAVATTNVSFSMATYGWSDPRGR